MLIKLKPNYKYFVLHVFQRIIHFTKKVSKVDNRVFAFNHLQIEYWLLVRVS